MGTLAAYPLIPSKLYLNPSSKVKPSFSDHYSSLFLHRPSPTKKNHSSRPVMRLFGPAIFEASKLKVLFLGVEEKIKHPGKIPRTYTLTHSDITAKLTLAISQNINISQLQGWYHRLQRDEVIAVWKKVKGKMSLHVHCHISGGHFLLDFCAKLRYYIFCKELPVVLKAFVHGDEDLFNNYPELWEAPVWVYFHSNVGEFNKVECWGPLKEALKTKKHDNNYYYQDVGSASVTSNLCVHPDEPCVPACDCCFLPMSSSPWAHCHHHAKQPKIGYKGTPKGHKHTNLDVI